MVGRQSAGVFTSWATDHRQTLGDLPGVIRCVAASTSRDGSSGLRREGAWAVESGWRNRRRWRSWDWHL